MCIFFFLLRLSFRKFIIKSNEKKTCIYRISVSMWEKCLQSIDTWENVCFRKTSLTYEIYIRKCLLKQFFTIWSNNEKKRDDKQVKREVAYFLTHTINIICNQCVNTNDSKIITTTTPTDSVVFGNENDRFTLSTTTVVGNHSKFETKTMSIEHT